MVAKASYDLIRGFEVEGSAAEVNFLESSEFLALERVHRLKKEWGIDEF